MANPRRLSAFWVLTGIIVVTQGISGVLDLLGTQFILNQLLALGYPAYVQTILGVAKVAGVTVLALPRLPRLKEWAYAGFVFDFGGAAASHALHGDSPVLIAPALVFLVIVLGSYVLRPADRRV